MDAETIIRRLDLAPHPEGGHYRETWRHTGEAGARGAGTAIFYLLRAGEVSRWHRIDAAEIWHHYAGAPLRLTVSPDGSAIDEHRLGSDLDGTEVPQVIIPAGAWQTAESLGDWTLVGCTVSPAFEFTGFELAAEGWQPG
ncbi:MAG: cupin domain-containing protein [Alphaproteobacteria bacterium]|nr:cupin domain-containing protein [Alphaproteobacteria bacterium]